MFDHGFEAREMSGRDPNVESAVATAMSALVSAIDEAHDLALSTLDPAELEALAVGVLHAGERANALSAKVVAHADRVQLVRRRSGRAKSLAAHLSGFTHGPTIMVNAPRNLGRWLEDFPVLADAWAAGTVTEAHLRELRKAHRVRIHLDMIRAQEMFVEHATTLDFTGFCNALGYWLLHVNPDGDPPDERNRSYGISMRTLPNGDVKLSGLFDPIVGEAMLTAIEHETKKVIENDKASCESMVGEEGRRTYRQNTLVALANLVTRGFTREDGTFPLPLVNIVMSETVAEDLFNRSFGGDHDPVELPIEWNDPDGRCETIRGTPVHPALALAPLLIGRLRRQILTVKDRKVSRDTRLFDFDLKNSLLILSRGRCTTFACDCPFMWLVADHVYPASLGGPTELDNGEIRCGTENAAKGNTPGV